MSAGLGIFLSAVFLGIIILYIKSDNKKKWHKVLRFSIISVVIIFLLIIGYLIFSKDKSIGENAGWKSDTVVGIKNIVLGTSLNEVQFQLGKFERVRETNSGYVEYKRYDAPTIFVDKNEKVIFIQYNCWVNARTNIIDDISDLDGVMCGSSSQHILNKFKSENVEIICSETNVEERFYDVPSKNYRFFLNRNRVESFMISQMPIKQVQLKGVSNCK